MQFSGKWILIILYLAGLNGRQNADPATMSDALKFFLNLEYPAVCLLCYLEFTGFMNVSYTRARVRTHAVRNLHRRPLFGGRRRVRGVCSLHIQIIDLTHLEARVQTCQCS